MGDVSGTLGSSLIKRIKIYGKKGESALDAFFLRWLHASGRFDTFCVPKCRTIPFLGCFLESCYIAHPRSRAKVSGKPVRGYEIGGKTAFRQEKCCTIRNLPRKSESCDKIRRFLPWSRCSQLPELIGRFVPATFAVKRSGESIDSGYSCESELVLHCFAERSQIQIRVFICQVSENPM